MYLNDFSVRVPEGNETSGGYVELAHNTQYNLVLNNNRNVRCDARVEIDGKHVGTWRIGNRDTLRLERPAHDDGHFTFYKVGTAEAGRIGLDTGDPNLGLVKVTFTPEKQQGPQVKEFHSYRSAGAHGVTVTDWAGDAPVAMAGVATYTSRSAGGTGLSGKSNQQFTSVHELDYDYSKQTVIHLRLVTASDEPRPLTSFSTPIPPSVA